MGGPIVAVLGTRYPDLSIEERVLHPLGATIRRGDGEGARAIVDVAGDAEVILCGSAPRFDRSTLEGLRCSGIVRYGIGTDSIDLVAARELGISVARVSDYGTEAVSFHAVTLAVAAMRRLVGADRIVRSGGWGLASLRPLHLPSAMTAGIVGYGRIGRATAALFAGLGFDVLAFDAYAPVPSRSGRIRAADSLERLLSRADVVSLHLPGGDAPLLDRERLSLLREGSILVNTARGRLVDEQALVEGMAAGRPAMAALDVFASEPPDLSRFTAVADRLIATPHMAWYTEESERRLRREAAEEAARLLRGERLRDPVVEPQRGRSDPCPDPSDS
ncbi:MAG TPA: NAD(P)-dependent oxidoreductase [Actinomycetes bacterium]|nr:NAD(P)-dependent oxidoreductase [Actinomycetes bacterium]